MFFLLNTLVTYGQQIEARKVFGGYKYRQYDKPLGTGKMVKAMKDEPEALRLVKSARKIEWVNTLFLCAGGSLYGDVLYNASIGNGLNLRTLGLGTGFLAIGFWLGAVEDRKKVKAVNIYNSNLTYYDRPVQIRLVNRGDNLGFSITF